jgi:hypothetical protein
MVPPRTQCLPKAIVAQSNEWIYLDSYDDLKAAIALYGKRGYDRCDRYNDNPQATLFMRKQIAERQSLRRT